MKSANTLFHFTDTKENLTSILENGIFIRYSLESFGNLIKGKKEVLFPMACFCDIPLSQIKKHSNKYGSYCLGLTKEWGKENGLSPVIYSHKNSETAKVLNKIVDDIESFLDIEDMVENTSFNKRYDSLSESDKKKYSEDNWATYSHLSNKNETISSYVSHFIKYIKPYEGTGYSNGKKLGKMRFYDEREWRYVPTYQTLAKFSLKDSYSKKIYRDPRRRRYVNMKLAVHEKLTFKPKDIRFIVVRNENEIPGLIKELNNIFEKKATAYELSLLTSRIISLDQVVEDL